MCHHHELTLLRASEPADSFLGAVIMKRPREEASDSPVEKVSKKAKEDKVTVSSDKGDVAVSENGPTKDSSAVAEANTDGKSDTANGDATVEDANKGSGVEKNEKGGDEQKETEKKDGDAKGAAEQTAAAEKSSEKAASSAKRGRKVKAKRPTPRKEGTTPRRAPRKEPTPPVVVMTLEGQDLGFLTNECT